MHKITGWFKVDAHRKYIYRLASAASVVAAGYGWISTEEAGLWIGFLGTALVTEVAAQNVNKGKGDDGE